MDANRRLIAAAEVLLIAPALLFLAAVVLRHLQQLQPEPAQTAEQIVAWYSTRSWTLWVLLIGLPFAALLAGCMTLLGNLSRVGDPRQAAGQPSAPIPWDFSTGLIAAATLSAGAVLVIVALHMLAN